MRSAVLFGILCLLTNVANADPIRPDQIAPRGAPSAVTLAGQDEPGERVVVFGKAVNGNTQAPLPGVSVFVFHADKEGLYSRDGKNDSHNPRIRGAIRSATDGSYRFDTTRPGSYRNNPAHIHYIVTADGFKDRMFEVIFADEPFLDDRTRKISAEDPEDHYPIVPVTRDKKGVWHATYDIKLYPQ